MKEVNIIFLNFLLSLGSFFYSSSWENVNAVDNIFMDSFLMKITCSDILYDVLISMYLSFFFIIFFHKKCKNEISKKLNAEELFSLQVIAFFVYELTPLSFFVCCLLLFLLKARQFNKLKYKMVS